MGRGLRISFQLVMYACYAVNENLSACSTQRTAELQPIVLLIISCHNDQQRRRDTGGVAKHGEEPIGLIRALGAVVIGIDFCRRTAVQRAAPRFVRGAGGSLPPCHGSSRYDGH